MTDTSVKKTLLYYVECKIKSNNYIQNVLLTIRSFLHSFCFEHHDQHSLFDSNIFVYPSNNYIIHGLEMKH